MSKIRWSFVGGVFVTITFLTLLAINLEIFRKNTEAPPVQLAAVQRPAETWMNIYQNYKKIGVVHRTFTATDNGFHFTENVFMQINTLGVIQPINISTKGELNTDMTVSSFNFDLTSSLFRFNAHGYVAKNKLFLFTGLPDAQQKSEINLSEIPHMSGSIYDAAFRTNLERDRSRNFSIFDPSTLAMRSIKVTRQADEIIPVMGKRILAQKYCADFMGSNTCAWIGKEGDVLKETGIMGLSLEKVSPEKAREGIAQDGSIDLTLIASIPVNIKIDKAELLKQLTIKISDIGAIFHQLNGGRQSFRKGVLTITKEQIPSSAKHSPPRELPPDVKVFLQDSPLVQANHPQMKEQVDKIIKPGDLPEHKIQKIVSWVYRHLEKKPVVSVPNALEVLKNRAGDCNEHAVLTTALLRTAGIPAQIETGLVYMRGRFYYHAWNIAYCGDWITVDAVFNQFPADVTHIRLVRGEGSEQLDLLGAMGKIKLEILEQIK